MISPTDKDLPSSFRASAAAPLVEDVLVRGRSTAEINFEALKSAQTPQAFAEETDALRQQLRRTIWFLLTGEDRSDNYRLHFGDVGGGEQADLVVTPCDDVLRVWLDGREFERRSVAIGRLAALSANVVPQVAQEVPVN